MAKSLVGSIELSKLNHHITKTAKGNMVIMIPIEQEGIYHSDKNRVYINVNTFVADTDDQHGNRATVTINQTKEQREAEVPKVYLGNLKQIWEGTVGEKQNNTSSAKTHIKTDDDDLPF